MASLVRILNMDLGIPHRSEFDRIRFTAILITIAIWLQQAAAW